MINNSIAAGHESDGHSFFWCPGTFSLFSRTSSLQAVAADLTVEGMLKIFLSSLEKVELMGEDVWSIKFSYITLMCLDV